MIYLRCNTMSKRKEKGESMYVLKNTYVHTHERKHVIKSTVEIMKKILIH